jgi:hypothetical protein
MGSLALELSEVFETNVPGMGIADSQTLILSRGVLSDATAEGKDASRSNSSISIQVDTNCVPLLARPSAV